MLKVGQLAGAAELGALTLDIFDAVADEELHVQELPKRERYQLRLLAGFFDAGKRWAAEDFDTLVEMHAAAVTPDENRPSARPTTLDDDESRWELICALASPGESQSREEAAAALIDGALVLLDNVFLGEEVDLEDDFVTKNLLPFLDRLAHVDEAVASVELDGYHSLYG